MAQVNFWKQKGVYILYDDNIHPVYAGQAGKSNAGDGEYIGGRLRAHSRGIYRNGWSLFSWFGFGSANRIPLRGSVPDKERLEIEYNFEQAETASELKELLASFEAILIEGFTPRFNARGGDLGSAVLVDQYDPGVGDTGAR